MSFYDACVLGACLACVYAWFTYTPATNTTNKTNTTITPVNTPEAKTSATTISVWHEQDEPEPSQGCRDYILCDERHDGPNVVRTEKGMFRLKIEPTKPNEAELKLLYLPTWSGSVTSPDATDIKTVMILVDKLTQVAKQKQIKIVRTGIPLGQSPMYRMCGFQRDVGYLRFMLRV